MDSSILCVWSELADESKSAGSEFQSVGNYNFEFESIFFLNSYTYISFYQVQLWTMANYYWYLKQSYNFEMKNKVACVSWDQEDAYK